MNITYKPGDIIDIHLKGKIKRISIEDDEICYTIIPQDKLNQHRYIYLEEKIDIEE